MREALPSSGDHWQLRNWLLRLEITHPRSKVWRDIVDDMRNNIHMHVHGEYEAKIGLYSGGRRLGEPTPEKLEAMRKFLDQRDQLSKAEREAILKVLCKGITPAGALCTPCHSSEPTLVDMSVLGYPPARVQELSDSAICVQL